MRWRVLALLPLLGLASCAPMMTGPRNVCEIVRQQVRDSSLPLALAYQWYSECGPYEVRHD